MTGTQVRRPHRHSTLRGRRRRTARDRASHGCARTRPAPQPLPRSLTNGKLVPGTSGKTAPDSFAIGDTALLVVPDHPMPSRVLTFSSKLPIDGDYRVLAEISSRHVTLEIPKLQAGFAKLATELDLARRTKSVCFRQRGEITAVVSEPLAVWPDRTRWFQLLSAIHDRTVALADQHRDATKSAARRMFLGYSLHGRPLSLRASQSSMRCG